VLFILFVIVLLALAGFFALSVHRPIEQIAVPPASSFSRALVRQGALLAAAGDCASCHTTATGSAYAGGVALQTPFGTIYGTNITPEPQTGIGSWSEAAFRRAMREGISRDGQLLYPAFPYNHFTHLSDQDIDALYAFVMTRDPVVATAPANQLAFPLQFRPLVAGWNLLYLEPGPLPPQDQQSAEWNRGAYLVASAGHCAACHSPHNALGAESTTAFLGGGDAEGWHATALNTASPSPVHWTTDALALYLRTGIAADHAMAAGPMQGVVNNLAQADPADVQAIAVYIQSIMGPPSAEQQARETAARGKAAQDALAAVQPSSAGPAADEATLALGATVYAGSCAGCHDMGRQLSSNTALRLSLAVALHLPDPRNLIHIIRRGIQPPDGERGRWMPPFEGSLTDEELAALVVWLRRQGTDAPPWNDVARTVKETGNAS
jgi:mono/diheme cytochrome c family protein